MWPIYFDDIFTFSPDLFSDKSIAFKFAVKIYIDLAQRIFPLERLTTGSSDPILTITDPSS